MYNYTNFIYEFIFENYDEDFYLIRKTSFEREVTDEFSAVSYGFDWLRKYEKEYGTCVRMKIYQKDIPDNIVCWVAKD